MESQVWTDVLAEEDIKLLEDVAVMTNSLLTQVYIFIDLMKQYIELVEQSSIFTPVEEENKNDDMSDVPTQTATEPAPDSMGNRAERRAKKTPFDAVGKPSVQPHIGYLPDYCGCVHNYSYSRRNNYDGKGY